MSAILHCLVHCVPLQRYFLRDIGHNHTACAIYRKTATKESGGRASNASRSTRAKADSVCLACEMDKLFLRYMGSTHGLDVLLAVNLESFRPPNVAEKESPTSSATMDGALIKGDPLIVADMLTAAWKCGGMNHLAGYEQRDAHEFLHGFLEILGKHVRQYRMRMYAAINAARPANSYMNIDPKIQHGKSPLFLHSSLFYGGTRAKSSVVLCVLAALFRRNQKSVSGYFAVSSGLSRLWK